MVETLLNWTGNLMNLKAGLDSHVLVTTEMDYPISSSYIMNWPFLSLEFSFTTQSTFRFLMFESAWIILESRIILYAELQYYGITFCVTFECYPRVKDNCSSFRGLHTVNFLHWCVRVFGTFLYVLYLTAVGDFLWNLSFSRG